MQKTLQEMAKAKILASRLLESGGSTVLDIPDLKKNLPYCLFSGLLNVIVSILLAVFPQKITSLFYQLLITPLTFITYL